MSDWLKYLIIICLICVVAFILWLIGSFVQFLNDNRFVYGLIVGIIIGLLVGVFGVLGIQKFIAWRKSI